MPEIPPGLRLYIRTFYRQYQEGGPAYVERRELRDFDTEEVYKTAFNILTLERLARKSKCELRYGQSETRLDTPARQVYVLGIYVHVTRTGKGKGLIRRELRDLETDEILKTGKLRHGLLSHAERQNWQVLRREDKRT